MDVPLTQKTNSSRDWHFKDKESLTKEIKNVSEIEINLIGEPKISIHTICDECGCRNWTSNSPGTGISIKQQAQSNDQKSFHSPYSVSITSSQKYPYKPTKVLSIAEKWERETNGNLNIKRSRTRSTGEIRSSKSEVNLDICQSCQERIGYSPLFSTVSSSLKWKRNFFKNHPLWISKPVQNTEMCSTGSIKFGSHVNCDIINCSKCCVKQSNKSMYSNDVTFETNIGSKDWHHTKTNNIQSDLGENISQKLKLLNVENQYAILNLIDMVSKVDSAMIVTNVVHSNCFNKVNQEMKTCGNGYKNSLPNDNSAYGAPTQDKQGIRTNTLFSKNSTENINLEELPHNALIFSDYNSKYQQNAVPTKMPSSSNSKEHSHDIEQCSVKFDVNCNNKRNSASTGTVQVYDIGSESTVNINSREQSLNENSIASKQELKNGSNNTEHNSSSIQFQSETPSNATSKFDSMNSLSPDENSSVKIRMYKTSREK